MSLWEAIPEPTSVQGSDQTDVKTPGGEKWKPTNFACPKCGEDVSERFYGPCLACRLELRVDAAHHDFTPVKLQAWEPEPIDAGPPPELDGQLDDFPTDVQDREDPTECLLSSGNSSTPARQLSETEAATQAAIALRPELQ